MEITKEEDQHGKMTFKERFFRFYLFPLIGWGLFVILAITIDLISNELDISLFFIYMLLWFVLSALIGGMLDFAENVYTPWKRKSIYNKSPFKELKEQGFELIEETHLEMQIDNFHYGVIWDGSFKPFISVMLLFKPADFESQEAEMLKETLKENDYKDIIVQDGMLIISFEYNFFRPKYSKIDSAIKTLKQASIALNLQPISNLELGELWFKHMESKYGPNA
ncbi:MAG: hypothetical protein ACPGLV_17860 [Bacteroidia bacterium]